MSDDAVTPSGPQLRSTILALLQERGPAVTICPSEVARRLDPVDWRPLMPEVRSEARLLAREGKLEIRQRGLAVAPDAKLIGPIRLALPAVPASAVEPGDTG